ncbi:hypothetical protein APR12_003904 [Nocardia amikacinitolerans]|uniref:hypothetical protein n=1 Tax=Nocardia amikacinitolerans TaxID=756689 RepID=UPI000B26EF08|nr:hypothetical protein [Nocardia amikacinitolerans]MCP2318549.1 hypothetical protein [Nocardia amikacinitolerans]
MFFTSNMRRGALRAAVAGAMMTIPLAAVAATAGAQAPEADAARVQQATESPALERTDVSYPHNSGNHGFPGRPGHNGMDSHGSGYSVYSTSPGTGPHTYQEVMPPTTSGDRG